MSKSNEIKRGSENIEVPIFSNEKMLKLKEEDRMISFVYEDLSKRNPQIPKNEILKVVFNSYVLEDDNMVDIYNNI